MNINQYHKLYRQLDHILNLDDLLKRHTGYHIRLKSQGYMDLSVEILEKTLEYIRISLTHYGELNGDLMADPDMEVKIYSKQLMAEALSYQNDYVSIYQVVYPEPNKVNVNLKQELNSFLSLWLNNLKDQGFKRLV